MNRTNIDWMKKGYTWNPISGCRYGCPYCYAASITKRFGKSSLGEIHEMECGTEPFPFGFDPTLYKQRLDEPFEAKKSTRIFVGSMADMFGPWVPKNWIDSVFHAMKKAPWHTYYILTKNPDGLRDYVSYFGTNLWVGTTIDTTAAVSRAKTLASIPCAHRFISFEPLLGNVMPLIDDESLKKYQWFIVGAQTGKNTENSIPRREWVNAIDAKAYELHIPLFMKSSLKKLYSSKLEQEIPSY